MLPILKKAAVGERKRWVEFQRGGSRSRSILSDCLRLDRWKVRVTAEQGGQEPFVKEFLMCNYFSIGWDAVVRKGYPRQQQ